MKTNATAPVNVKAAKAEKSTEKTTRSASTKSAKTKTAEKSE